MGYKIIGDSCTDLTKELKKDSHYTIVPLSIHIDEFTIVDDNTFDQKDFLAKIAASPNCAKSSCPDPETYMQAYKGKEDIYVITLSSNLSGSYNSACLAKKLYTEEYGAKNIEVFDSCSASIGQTLIAMKIQELADKGKSFQDIVKEAKQFIGKMQTKFVLESLETLRKNGRLSNIKAILCNVLNIKPVMFGTPDGKIEKLDQARGINKALKLMVESIKKDAKNPEQKIVGIAHCNNYERALFVKEEILKSVSFKDVIIVETAGISSLYASNGGIIVAY